MNSRTPWTAVGLILIASPSGGFSDDSQSVQEAAIAAIAKFGGETVLDEKSPNAPAVEVYLSGPQVTDTALKHLKGLSELRVLYVGNSRITDAGLQHLQGLSELQVLNLSNTKVTDAGLVNLKGLSKLQSLDFRDTAVTRSGLEQLKRLTKLERPLLGKTKFIPMPKMGGNVVSKGSFSAWTVPEDPMPGQSYLIVIQITLPKEVTRLPRSDLSCDVVGTDGYRQDDFAVVNEWVPVKGSLAQLSIPVPGAKKLVKDTVHIRSKRLKESQKLEIVF